MTSSQSNRILAVIVAFTFLAGATFVAALVKVKSEPANLADLTISVCQIENAESHSEDVVSILLSAGWTSTPADNAERLYSPACNVEVTESGEVHAFDVNGNEVRP